MTIYYNVCCVRFTLNEYIDVRRVWNFIFPCIFPETAASFQICFKIMILKCQKPNSD